MLSPLEFLLASALFLLFVMPFFVYGWLLSTLVWICQIGSTARMKRSLNFEEDQLVETFIADQPFVWFLRDNDSGMWIFLGRHIEPIFFRADPDLTSTHHNDEL